jgi:hypothetical protein
MRMHVVTTAICRSDIRQLADMRAGEHSIAPKKPHPFINRRCIAILCSKSERRKSAARLVDDRLNELAADSVSANSLENAYVATPADPRIRHVGINIQTASRHQPSLDRSHKKRLAKLIESISADGPLVDEPSHEPPSSLLALFNQCGKSFVRQI